MNGQKFIKNAKNGQLGQKLMEKAKLWLVDGCSQTVLPDRSVVIGQKLVENAQIIKFKCDILSDFKTQFLKITEKVSLRAKQATFTFWVDKSSLKNV